MLAPNRRRILVVNPNSNEVVTKGSPTRWRPSPSRMAPRSNAGP